MSRIADFGALLKRLRGERDLPVRRVAAEIDVDPSLLCRWESGERLPTPDQTRAMAAFFSIPEDELEAARITQKFWNENHDNPALNKAVMMIQESAPDYVVNKSVNNRRKTSG